MLTKDTAICIRAIDYSETSQIVTFFTRATGKISAIAKGSKRPKSAFGSPLEILSHGKIVVSVPTREKLATLTEFEQQPYPAPPGGNLFALYCRLFAVELVDSMTNEYDPHPELFDNFLQFLQNLRQVQDTLGLLILFQLALLKEVGLQPILNACVNCKTRYDSPDTRCELYFSSSANGLICRDCEAGFQDKIKLTCAAAVVLSNLKLIAETDQKTLSEIEKVLISYFTDTLGKPPKMAKYILKAQCEAS